MKKLGIISLALVLALGALGAAYAPWTDEIEIVQVVNTGSLEVGVSYEEPYFLDDDKQVATVGVTPGNLKFEMWDYYWYDSITTTVGNLYPCVTVWEEFHIGAAGTVPVHLDVTLTFDGDMIVYDCMTIEWYIVWPTGGEEGMGPAEEQLEEIAELLTGYQLHENEVISITLKKHLQQCAGENMGKEASFTLAVTGYQYNWEDPSVPPGNIWNVYEEDGFAGIQAAIDAASPGDFVVIHPGTYSGTTLFAHKENLTVYACPPITMNFAIIISGEGSAFIGTCPPWY